MSLNRNSESLGAIKLVNKASVLLDGSKSKFMMKNWPPVFNATNLSPYALNSMCFTVAFLELAWAGGVSLSRSH